MRRGGKHAALEDGSAAAGFDEMEFAMEADFVFDAETAIEVEQIDAAAQQDVLAVVDHLGIFAADGPGGGAAAEEVAGFVDVDFESCAAESDGGGEAGEAAADYGDARHYSRAAISSPVWRRTLKRARSALNCAS